MTQNSRQPGSDPLGDFQRWLLRSSARGFGRDVRGNLRKTFGYGADGRDDVWESATNEPPGGEPPECEWCPLCRAARKFKDSGPGLGSHLSSVGEVFATVVQDAVDAFEAVIAARPGPGMPPDNAGPGEPADGPDPATPAGGADPDAHAAAAAADSDAHAAAAAADPAHDGDADESAAAAGEPGGADESAAAAGEPGGADAEQQAGTGGSQERPASGPDDRS